MANYLAPILSKYFTNFDSEKLVLSYWGTVKLDDLILKADVLDQYNLPFKVLGGKVGHVYVNVGVGGAVKLVAGFASVVDVTLTDVHVLLVHPIALPYNKEKTEAAELYNKRSELESINAKQMEILAGSGKEAESGPGYVQRLITGIINNIRIKIENIHIRYEDNILKPESPFSFGVVLKKLNAETSNKDGVPTQIGKDPTFFKMVDIKTYGLYWNSYETNMISANTDASVASLNAIVSGLKNLTTDENLSKLKFRPLSTMVKAMVTMHPENLPEPFSLPKMDVDLKMEDITIGLSNEQFGEALVLAESLETINRGFPYRKYRPYNIRHKGHAKEWWKFAYNCVLDEVKRRKQNYSWEYLKAHCKLVKAYKVAYAASAKKGATNREKYLSQKLEDQLDNISIMVVRSKINLRMHREKKLIDEKSYRSWGILHTYVPTDEEIKQILTEDMTDEEKATFNDISDETVVYPGDVDYTEFKLNIELATSTLNILNTFKDTVKIETVTKLVVGKVNLSAESHPAKHGFSVEATLATLNLTGLQEGGRPGPKLLKSASDGKDAQFLFLSYERNPFDCPAESRIRLSSKSLELTYHTKTVQRIVDTFTWPDEVELSSTTAAISSSYNTLKETSLQGFQEIAKDTSAIDIDIEIRAPHVFFPENGELSKSSSVLVIYLGTFTFKSAPQESDGINCEVAKTPETENASGELSPDIIKQMYNEYNIRLFNFEVFMALPGESLDGSAKTRKTTSPPLLNKGEILVDLKQCKVTNDARFPKIKLDVRIPLLDIDFAESRVLPLIRLLFMYPLPVRASPKENHYDITHDPNANYLAELNQVIYSGTVELDKAISEKDDNINNSFDPENATQLTSLICSLNVPGVKLRVSKVDHDAKIVPVLEFWMAEISASYVSKTYGNMIKLWLGGIIVTYCEAKIQSYVGPINLLQTPLPEKEGPPSDPFVEFNIFIANDDCFKQTPATARLHVNAKVTSLYVILHEEALILLLAAADRISGEISKIKTARESGGLVEENNDKPEVVQKVSPTEKVKTIQQDEITTKFDAILTSFNIYVTSETRPVALISMKKLLADCEDSLKKTTVILSLDALEITNSAPLIRQSKILEMKENEELLRVEAILFKESDICEHSHPNIELTMSVGSPRLLIDGTFFANVINFVNKFQSAKKAVVDASVVASKKAILVVVDTCKTKEGTKISVDLKIGAPEVLLISTANTDGLVIVLGDFCLKNRFTAVTTSDPSRHAILDNMNISLSGCKISKAALDNNSAIIAETVFLEPVSLTVDLIRNLSYSWHEELPQYRIVVNVEETMFRLCVEDIVFIISQGLDVVSSMYNSIDQQQKSAHADDILEPEDLVEVSTQSKEGQLSMAGSIKRIGLAIYSGPTVLEAKTGLVPHDAKFAIGEFAIWNLTFGVNIRNESYLALDFVCNEIALRDLRSSSYSNKDILRRTGANVQIASRPIIIMTLSRTVLSNGGTEYAVNCQTISMEVILNSDFTDELKNIAKQVQTEVPILQKKYNELSKAIEGNGSTGQHAQINQIVKVKSPTTDVQNSLVLINGKVRLNEFKILLLENATATSTNAIEIFLEGILDIKSDAGTSFGIGELKLGCNTVSYDATSTKRLAEILRPATLKIKAGLSPQREIDAILEASEVNLRFSAGTLRLFQKIVSDPNKSAATVEEIKTPEPDYSKVWELKENDTENYWFLQLELIEGKNPVNADNTSECDPDPTGNALEEKERVIHEKMKVAFTSITISLEVGVGSMTTPLLVFDVGLDAELTNWSDDLIVVGQIRATVAYNNSQVGGMEYLVEPVEIPKSFGESTYKPWEMNFLISKPAATNAIQNPVTKMLLFSEEPLEITISKTGLTAWKGIMLSFNQSFQQEASNYEVKSAPYTFKNDVGYSLTLVFDKTSSFTYLKEDELVFGNVPLTAGDKIDLGLNLHQNLSSSERTLDVAIPELKFHKIVNARSNHSSFFPIDKKNSPGENCGVLFEISSDQFCTTITIRSILQLQNEIDVPIDVYTEKKVFIGTVQPSGSFNVPLPNLYENPGGLLLQMKGYKLSTTPLKWNCLRNAPRLMWRVSTANISDTGAPANLKVIGVANPAVVHENTEKLSPIGKMFTLSIRGDVVLHNLLPMQLIFATNTGSEFCIDAGKKLDTFYLTPGHQQNEHSFTLKLPGFRGKSWTSRVKLQPNSRTFTSLKFISDDQQQSICFGYKTEGNGKQECQIQALTIYVYSPYWFVNFTGLNLFYKSADGINVSKHSAGATGPMLFGPEQSLGAKTRIKCEDSEWSNALPLENNTGVPVVIVLKAEGREYQLILSCELSSYSLTRIVTFAPRYNILNSSLHNLILEEYGLPTANIVVVSPLESKPFWPIGNSKKFTVRVEGTQEKTTDISCEENIDTILRLNNKYGGIRAWISQTLTKTLISLSELNVMEAPLLIVNDTGDATIEFNMIGVASARQVGPGKSILYAWDNFTFLKTKTIQWELVGSKAQPLQINFDQDKHGEVVFNAEKTYKWISFTKSMQRILLLTLNDRLVEYLAKLDTGAETPSIDVSLALRTIGISVVDSTAGKDILYLRITSMAPLWESSLPDERHFKLLPINEQVAIETGFQKFLNGASQPMQLDNNITVDFRNCSLQRPRSKDHKIIRHCYRPGLALNFKLFPSSFNIELKVNRIQIDSQLDGTKFPICFRVAPIIRTTATETEVHPHLLCIKMSKVSNGSVDFISGQFVLQKFELQLDMGLVDALTDFTAADDSGKSKKLQSDYESDYALASRQAKDYYKDQFAIPDQTITIFELVELHKMECILTFSLAGGESGTFTSVLRGFGAALVDVSEASLDIAGIKIDHVRLTNAEFVDIVVGHYKSLITGNVLKLICNLDIIGNPLKLLEGIGHGLSTLLVEPLNAGLEGHFVDGLEYGLQGVGQVFGSLTDSVAGVASALGKTAGSIGLSLPGSIFGIGAKLLRQPGKLTSGELQEQLETIRPARPFLEPMAVMKPYSYVTALGVYLTKVLNSDPANPYLFHAFVGKNNVILVSRKTAYFLEMQDDMRTIGHKHWEILLSSVDSVVFQRNTLSFIVKSRGWGSKKTYSVPISDTALGQWILVGARGAILYSSTGSIEQQLGEPPPGGEPEKKKPSLLGVGLLGL